MPFIEVITPESALEQSEEVIAGLTSALAEAWDINPSIVTTYLIGVPNARYGHAGQIGPAARAHRVFVKIHSFRRDAKARRRAAVAIAAALVEAGVPDEAAIVYFLEREPDEVSHGGRLASDNP